MVEDGYVDCIGEVVNPLLIIYHFQISCFDNWYLMLETKSVVLNLLVKA